MKRWIEFDNLPDVTQDDIAREVEERFGAYRPEDDLVGLVNPPLFLVYDMPIAKIKGYRRNPSKSVVDRYIKMIEKNKTPPILVDGNKFIDGGHRLAAYIQAEKKTIPAVDVGRLFRLWPEWVDGEANELERIAKDLLKMANNLWRV